MHSQLSAEQERLWLLVGMRRLEKGWDEAAEPRNSSGWAWGRAAELTFPSHGWNHQEVFKAQGGPGTTQVGGGHGGKHMEGRTWK